jgi:uncharacterized membrane protein
MSAARAASLLVATLTTGLMAGVFGLYANAIMPGLRRTDDRTFVGAFQAVDTAVINPLFLLTLFVAFAATGAAAILHLGRDERSVLPWCVAAFVLYGFVLVSTLAVNVPRNDAIKAAGPLDRISDLAAVRNRFDERTWARWNLARAVTSTVSFGLLAWALVEHGHNA